MRSRSVVRGLRAIILGLAVAVVMAGAGMAVTAGVAEARVRCPSGYVCLQPVGGGPPVLIPEGQRREFPGGLRVTSAANRTGLNYCVVARPVNYTLPPGADVKRWHVVLGIAPRRACLTEANRRGRPRPAAAIAR